MLGKTKLGIICIGIIIALVFFAGCEAACKYANVGCSDLVRKVYASEDPQSCKSITVDCSKYGDNGYYSRVDSIIYRPFSDSSGCGCIAILNAN
jgi:hypothetical protein